MAGANIDDALDRVSELPESILHHILSFLPVKDAARTSILSKRWEGVWDTLPYLDFYLDFFDTKISSTEGKRRHFQQLLESANKIILSRCQHIASIEKLRLWIPDISAEQWLHTNKPLDVTIERLISYVAHTALKELYFTNSNACFAGLLNLPCTILSAKSLNVLSLYRFDLRTLSSSLDVKFPSLSKLYLGRVFLEDDIMGKLIVGCPSLEDLKLYDCQGLKTIYLTGLPKLKQFVVLFIQVELIVIEAPKLQVLEVLDPSPLCQVIVATCSSLSEVRLYGEFIEEQWLHHFISQCLFLEKLMLSMGSRIQGNEVRENVARISSYSLKNLIFFSRNLKVEITAPNLKKLCFESYDDLLPTISLNASDLLEVELELRRGRGISGDWRHLLAKFLGPFNHFNTVKLRGDVLLRPAKAIISPEENRLSLLSPLCGTRNLIFSASTMEFEAVELVEYMFWLSPRATTLSIGYKDNEYINKTYAVLKLRYGENVHKDSLCPLCKFNDCWHKVLLEVTFEKFEGGEDERRKMEDFFLKHVKDLKIVRGSCNVLNPGLAESGTHMTCLQEGHKGSKLQKIQ
ncbi:hypothetical protein M9H77_34267 [Catharanthus roseus]|uniref:Uncharacterized protein n=1 Tax=Catharanthus roseus TaxID=4058 RepID=A0ACB9ZKQ1_CATRO|nr:hypothetical protein M9H77_34267 [Catharanthus roseus]